METKDGKIRLLEERIRAFEEDRYCSDGCVEYQLDKINLYKQYFAQIKEFAILVKSSLIARGAKCPNLIKQLDFILNICEAACDGTRWI